MHSIFLDSVITATNRFTESQSTSSSSTNLKNAESLLISENHFASYDHARENKTETNEKQEMVEWSPVKHPFLTASFSQPANAKDMQDLLADFRYVTD